MNEKGLSKKMFKRVWQVVETIFFASKITLFVETCENLEFFIFYPAFVGWSRRKLYEKKWSAIFFVSDKKCERYLARRWGTSTTGCPTKFLITRLIMRCCMSHKFFFSNFKYIRKYLQNCVWLSYLFPFQKRFAKTGEFRPSKAGPCLNNVT